MFRRLKDLIVNKILGVADTPQRIAFGVFLGCIVAFTPTIGLQIVLYVAIATLLRANKVSGIPILFISNPVTAVPLYWFCWWVGAWVMHGGAPQNLMDRDDLAENLGQGAAASSDWTNQIFTGEFWKGLGSTLAAMGAELWVGSLILGVLAGMLAYPLTVVSVRVYRRARGPRH